MLQNPSLKISTREGNLLLISGCPVSVQLHKFQPPPPRETEFSAQVLSQSICCRDVYAPLFFEQYLDKLAIASQFTQTVKLLHCNMTIHPNVYSQSYHSPYLWFIDHYFHSAIFPYMGHLLQYQAKNFILGTFAKVAAFKNTAVYEILLLFA